MIVAGEERGTNVRVGVVGSGALAAVRADAFAASHRAEVVVVASRHLANARRLTGRYGARALDSYEAMADEGLDAVLVAVPHRRQDEIVAWALDHRLHVLIGGPLASDLTAARRVAGRAGHSGLVVEAGYEARYKAVWRTARRILEEGGIGTPVSVRSSAAFEQTPESWYYEQEASGGMLVTHLTYAFLNPLRWLLGTPRVAGAVGNARRVVRARHRRRHARSARDRARRSRRWPPRPPPPRRRATALRRCARRVHEPGDGLLRGCAGRQWQWHG